MEKRSSSAILKKLNKALPVNYIESQANYLETCRRINDRQYGSKSSPPLTCHLTSLKSAIIPWTSGELRSIFMFWMDSHSKNISN